MAIPCVMGFNESANNFYPGQPAQSAHVQRPADLIIWLVERQNGF